MKIRYYLYLLAIILLSGCATIHPTTPMGSWAEHEQVAAQLSQWRLLGKIAITQQQKNHSARLNWFQQQQNFDLLVSGPLGQGSVAIKGDGKQTRIASTHGEKQISGDLGDYLAKTYGWYIPVENLSFWIRGLPGPNSTFVVKTDDLGYPTTIQQAGWTISYDKFSAATKMPIMLPRRLTVVNGDYQLKILIQSWTDLVVDKRG